MAKLTLWDPWRRMRWPSMWDEDFEMEIEDTELDMYESDDEVVVKLKAPGFDEKNIDITIEGSTLTLKGETKEEEKEEDKKKKYYRREIRQQSFARSVTLPVPVKSDQAKAEFKQGILTLTLPKAEEAKPKTIKVKAEGK